MRWRSNFRASARLLGVRLELLFERGELGKGRIGIRLAVAAIPALSSSLDIFRPQRRIAIRTFPAGATLGPLATVATFSALATLGMIERFGTAGTRPSVWARLALRALAAAFGRGTAAMSAAAPFVAGGSRSNSLDRSHGNLIGRASGRPLRGSRRSSLACAMRPTPARSTLLPRLARVLVAAAGPPHLDQLRLSRFPW
jgi:hypothetical protein